MNDWREADHRRTATRAFCEWLHDPVNKQYRIDCTITLQNEGNPGPAYRRARELFAEKGGFVREESYQTGTAPREAIPGAVEFRVFEEIDIMPRDKLVTIVLPRPDQPLPVGSAFDVGEIYRCTWTPWAGKILDQRRRRSLSLRVDAVVTEDS